MDKKNKKKYLKILELDENASLEDIRFAYNYLIKLYTSDSSPELEPLRGELSAGEKGKIIELLNKAYEKLTGDKNLFNRDFEVELEPEIIYLDSDNEGETDNNTETKNIVEKGIEITSEEESIKEVTGKYLKKLREEKGLKIKDAAELLNISYKYIVQIENEKFEKLTDPGYLRWFVSLYLKFLGINEKKGTEDYMKRYRSKK